MALETGTYTNDLVVSNPVAADGLGQADDHLRLIKAALKNTFVGFTSAPLASSQAQLDAAVAAVAGTGTPLRMPAGAVALPGLTPVGDPDTGFYQASANTVSLAVGGVNVFTASSGSLGVTGNVTASGGVAAAAVAATGAYSGGTGQLVPIGGMILWLEDTLPAEGGYCWANGGTLSRTANPQLWARWGTKYGVGDGTTTFNVINMCEVVPVGQRAMGGVSSRALLATGVLGGAAFGEATHVLSTGEMPSHNHGTTELPHTHGGVQTSGGATAKDGSGSNNVFVANGGSTASATTGLTVNFNGGGAAHNNVQPSTAVNYIIRIG